jgi:hypothetical protein
MALSVSTTKDGYEYCAYMAGLYDSSSQGTSDAFAVRKRKLNPSGGWSSLFHVTHTGYLVSNTGKIGGFNIQGTCLYIGKNSFLDSQNNPNITPGVYIGVDGLSLGSGFRVTRLGELTATSGTIGGFILSSTWFGYQGDKLDKNNKVVRWEGFYLAS